MLPCIPQRLFPGLGTLQLDGLIPGSLRCGIFDYSDRLLPCRPPPEGTWKTTFGPCNQTGGHLSQLIAPSGRADELPQIPRWTADNFHNRPQIRPVTLWPSREEELGDKNRAGVRAGYSPERAQNGRKQDERLPASRARFGPQIGRNPNHQTAADYGTFQGRLEAKCPLRDGPAHRRRVRSRRAAGAGPARMPGGYGPLCSGAIRPVSRRSELAGSGPAHPQTCCVRDELVGALARPRCGESRHGRGCGRSVCPGKDGRSGL